MLKFKCQRQDKWFIDVTGWDTSIGFKHTARARLADNDFETQLKCVIQNIQQQHIAHRKIYLLCRSHFPKVRKIIRKVNAQERRN